MRKTFKTSWSQVSSFMIIFNRIDIRLSFSSSKKFHLWNLSCVLTAETFFIFQTGFWIRREVSLFCVCAFEECLKSKKWKQHSREKHIFISEKKENIFWQNLTQKLKRANIFSRARQTKPELKKGKVEQQKVLNQKGWKIGNTLLKNVALNQKYRSLSSVEYQGRKVSEKVGFTLGLSEIGGTGLWQSNQDFLEKKVTMPRDLSPSPGMSLLLEKKSNFFQLLLIIWGVWQDFLSFGLDRI